MKNKHDTDANVLLSNLLRPIFNKGFTKIKNKSIFYLGKTKIVVIYSRNDKFIF